MIYKYIVIEREREREREFIYNKSVWLRFNDRKCDGFAMVYTYIIVYVCVCGPSTASTVLYAPIKNITRFTYSGNMYVYIYTNYPHAYFLYSSKVHVFCASQVWKTAIRKIRCSIVDLYIIIYTRMCRAVVVSVIATSLEIVL